MTTPFQNEMILASAGSGKTWQLTNRFIAIMAQQYVSGAKTQPERIIAITFTRKAAGEFFDSIITKLANAASSDEECKKLANASSYPILRQLNKNDFRNLLEIFVQSIPKLSLGTLDSFFSQILRSFPSEFGLPNQFAMLNEADLLIQRQQIYQKIFLDLDEQKADRFFASFRRALAGSQKASIQTSFDQYITNHHSILVSAPEKQQWGEPASIWPNGSPWIVEKSQLKNNFDQLFQCFEQNNIKPKQLDYWEEFRNEAHKHTAGTSFASRTKFFLKKFHENWQNLQQGNASFAVNRLKQNFDVKECELITTITQTIISQELLARCEKTQGLWDLLWIYEKLYANDIRQQGKLTFRDLEILLNTKEPSQLLSQSASQDQLLQIEYRLDARYDHWLLDEFQDTSYAQWSILENLADEAIQDTSGERSLFLVGDIKQAIYAWRGGDTELFHDIYRRYQDIGERSLQKGLLTTSWRSGNDIIDPVNMIFGDQSALKSLDLPEKTLALWQWEKHQVAEPHSTQEGYTAFYGVERSSEEENPKFHVVLELLKQIQPTKRNLSCVILVQKNKTGHDLVDYIRQHSDIPIASEADVSIAIDNPVTLAALHLLRWIAHPTDEYAWQHILMTPMRHKISTLGKEQLHDLLSTILHEHGFEQCLLYIRNELISPHLLDSFSTNRFEELIILAQEIDLTGSRDIDEFLTVSENHKTRELTSSSSVQVMTIHKAKGLTFDCAILPELGGNKLTSLRNNIGIQRNPQTRDVEWVYDLPVKEVSELDPVLHDHLKDKEAEAAYEALCKFYVGLTRARYANYLITDRTKKSRSNNFEALLMDILADEEPVEKIWGDLHTNLFYETKFFTSNKHWYNNFPLLKTEDPTAKQEQDINGELDNTTLPYKNCIDSQSAFDEQQTRIETFGSIEYGILVHQLLEEIEWYTPSLDTKKLWKKHQSHPLYQEAAEETLTFLNSSSTQILFSPPSENYELWREQSFEAVVDNIWQNGTFDRVILTKNTTDEVTNCLVIDFKTTKKTIINTDIYQQIELYHSVLKQMFPNAKIECFIAFTAEARIESCRIK